MRGSSFSYDHNIVVALMKAGPVTFDVMTSSGMSEESQSLTCAIAICRKVKKILHVKFTTYVWLQEGR